MTLQCKELGHQQASMDLVHMECAIVYNGRANPFCAEFWLGIIKSYLYLPSSLNSDMAQLVEILPDGR